MIIIWTDFHILFCKISYHPIPIRIHYTLFFIRTLHGMLQLNVEYYIHIKLLETFSVFTPLGKEIDKKMKLFSLNFNLT